MLDGFSLKQPAGTGAGKGSHADCFRPSSPPDWKAQETKPTASVQAGTSATRFRGGGKDNQREQPPSYFLNSPLS